MQFEKYTLPNGLEVILSQKRGLPMVAVNLWYHVGPANEDKGRTGFAHLFEHMMFQSSKHVPPDSHIRLLEAAGASDLNGTTDYDRTNYFETVPSNQVELALWLESDRMGYLLDKIDQAALSNQQDVVRNERRQSVENEPYGLAEETLVQTLFPAGHPYYGNVIGSHEDIQAAKLDDVKKFFRQYYAPNNASLAIVGDFDPAQMKALVQKYFGTLKRGPAVPPIKAETPKITAERRKVVHGASRVAARVHGVADLADPQAGRCGCRHRRHAPWRRPIEPSVQEAGLREADRPERVGAAVLADARIDVPDSKPPRVRDIRLRSWRKRIEEELALFRSKPAETREIERARNRSRPTSSAVSSGSVVSAASPIASTRYNHYLGQSRLSAAGRSALSRGDRGDAADVRARSARADGARRDARGARTAGRAAQVATPPASQAAAGAGSESINADEPWRNEMPKPGRGASAAAGDAGVGDAAERADADPQRASRPADRRRQSGAQTGSDANPLDKPGLANFAAAMLDEGTSTRNALQIADEVAQLGASLGINSSMDATTLSARSLSKNFGATVDLLADVTLRPSFPAEEIERQRASRLAALVQQRDNPGQVAAQVTASALYGPKHPYGYTEIGTEAALKSVSRADMEAFWKQNFVPNNAALVVAGDISMNELTRAGRKGVRRMAARHTGAARARHTRHDAGPRGHRGQAGKPADAAARGEHRRAAVLAGLPADAGHEHGARRTLLEPHQHEPARGARLHLRRELAVLVQARGRAVPDRVRRSHRRDRGGRGRNLQGVRGMVEKPVSADELQKAKDSLANSLPGAFESSANAVGNFSNVFIYNLGLDYYTRYAEQVNAVTTDQALAVSKKYLVPANMVVVAVGDRSKIEPELRKLESRRGGNS